MPKRVKLIEAENRMVLPGAGVGEHRGLLFNDYKVSVTQHESSSRNL